MENRTYKNILIIKMSSLGDVIHALPSLYVLRRTYPEARITWAVHPAFAALLPGKPWIDEIFFIDRKKIKNLSYLMEVRKALHARHFDLVIDLQMIAKSALISLISGGRKKIGYWDAREGSFLVNHPVRGKHMHGHIIEQLLDVMEYLHCDVSHFEFPLREHEKEKTSVKYMLSQCGVTGAYVVLVPGTRGEHKKWPISFWGELAKRLAGEKIYTVISGAPSEAEMGKEIRAISPSNYTVDLIGRTNLLELAALDEMASLHISCDTGPLHIANAAQTPLIALFGPTLPGRSGPYGNPDADVLLAENPGRMETDMATISVDQVFELAMKKMRQIKRA